MRNRVRPLLYLMITVAFAACSSSDPDSPTDITARWPPPDPVTITPPGFIAMPATPDNPLTRQGIALGRMLFYDPILSGDSTLACAGCHHLDRAFADTGAFSTGITNEQGRRSAPTIINPAWQRNTGQPEGRGFFWDGRALTLEDQAVEPVRNPIEMRANWDVVVAKLQSHAEYPGLFGGAFGTNTITRDLVVKAIAQFERTFISATSPYHVWLLNGGDDAAANLAGFSDAAKRGASMFQDERADCFHCHEVNVFLTDHSFRNAGLDSVFTGPDLGLFEITSDPNDYLKFKVPTLLNVEASAPYMHDGRFATLREVVEHYNDGVFDSATLDPILRKGGIGLGLSPQDVDDLVEFLKTMTDTQFLGNPDLSTPFPAETKAPTAAPHRPNTSQQTPVFERKP